VNITCGICHLLYIKLRRILDQNMLVVEDRIKDGECLEEYQEEPHIVNADLAVIANKIEENQKIWDAEIKEVVRCLQDMDAKIKEIIRVL
jgi:predicted GTPase